jgi:hypothetical protein
MDEVERLVGMGTSGVFFRLRNHPKLGVKINYVLPDGKAELEDELNKAKILKKLGISIPEYVDVIQVMIPSHIEATIKKNPHVADYLTSWEYNRMKKFLLNHTNQAVWGLVMEYIADDVVIFNSKGINGLISRSRLEKIYDAEIKKIESHGIHIKDNSYGLNVIWSESRAKLYFIDFELWDLSNLK